FVVAIGDSSPFDDGTGDKNDILHDGWSYGDDAKLAVNIVKFLSSH
ncbi:MAG: OB-fold nucleic acid binding domain protein, partial [Thermosipho sp. (in: Bacteria)]|nr:OB-fold nucleic acid binding domain protein [Thermosipho sp. (in: thermotogales)]